MKIIVTGGAIIKDVEGRILLQQRSDYGDWGLPGGGMEPGETVEQTMIREVLEETGLTVNAYELLAIYSGPRMRYQYPDGNQVVFVMFIFNAKADAQRHLAEDGVTLVYKDGAHESIKLQFRDIEDISMDEINQVQRPVFEDMLQGNKEILRY
ncbi:NUDIX domain-containing protein [Marinicrinis lubricantis]|uniref:NUDIX domain-containing protein n=1 Tax=Marinicrinis lubricantis TaxID=2086470 RepID=A0ABW1IQ98_9BACL